MGVGDTHGWLQHRQRIDGPLCAGCEQPDRDRRDLWRRHHLAGNTRSPPRVAIGKEGWTGGLVTCVLPAGTDDPSWLATNGSETSASDCESSVSDRLYASRMTAC